MAKKSIDWELGSIWFWVAFGREKPFPVFIFRQDGVWTHEAHPHRPLTEQQEQLLESFVGNRAVEIADNWVAHTTPRLNWSKSNLTRITNESSEE